jgi:hypothetical protein
MRACPPLLLAAALFATTPIVAASPSHAAEVDAPTTASQLETVMLATVDGEVQFDESGTVTAARLDTPLPDDLRASLDARVRGWRFAPVLIDGQPRKVRAGMRIVLAAARDGDAFQVRVDNATFAEPGDAALKAGASIGDAIVASDLRTPPRYPAKVLRMAALNARVLLGIQVGADGKVVDVVPVQSALYDLKGRPTQVAPFLLAFERSAVAAARQWTFKVPADAATRSPQELTVMMPVNYGSPGAKPLKPGEWRYTIRTPKRPLPWVPAEMAMAQAGADDLPTDAAVPLAGTVRLLTDERGRAL